MPDRHCTPVKSFSFHRREPTIVPTRFASDYTEEELAALRESFRPLVGRYRRYSLVGVAFFFLGSGSLLMSALVEKDRSAWFVGVFVLCWLSAAAISLLVPMPSCPSCCNRLNRELGPFCPECGAKAMQPARWFGRPRCSSCAESISFRGRSRSPVRACTHCGALLDEKGL